LAGKRHEVGNIGGITAALLVSTAAARTDDAEISNKPISNMSRDAGVCKSKLHVIRHFASLLFGAITIRRL
jgi:hypothetical protein